MDGLGLDWIELKWIRTGQDWIRIGLDFIGLGLVGLDQ